MKPKEVPDLRLQKEIKRNVKKKQLLEELKENIEEMNLIFFVYISKFCISFIIIKFVLLKKTRAKMSDIQLLYRIVCNNKKQIKLNSPFNYKTEVLFSQLPYLVHLDNPIFFKKKRCVK